MKPLKAKSFVRTPQMIRISKMASRQKKAAGIHQEEEPIRREDSPATEHP
jgi:hypothetical protein